MTAPLRLCVRRSDIVGSAGPATEVAVVVPSDVRHIEEAVELMARHCFSGLPPSPRMRFRLQVTLSEALANAMICGNGEDPSKTVAIRAECHRDLIELTVTDEGVGFDPDDVANPATAGDIESQCGRGLFLIWHLSDEVAFNAQGNSICIKLRRPSSDSTQRSTP